MTAVMSWLPTSATCSLLFRATADGKTPTDFHRCCDNKGPTLVVIQSGEYICGGYTLKSWTSPRENEHSLFTSRMYSIYFFSFPFFYLQKNSVVVLQVG